MKITEFQKKQMLNRLTTLESEIKYTQVILTEAYEKGDTRENSDLDAAKNLITSLNREMNEIKSVLNKSETVDYDTSELIRVGSLVEIEQLSSLGPSVKQVMVLSDEGDPITQGVLSTKSLLGKKIVGQTSGTFNVGKYKYKITKLTDTSYIDTFISEYKDSDTAIKRFLDE